MTAAAQRSVESVGFIDVPSGELTATIPEWFPTKLGKSFVWKALVGDGQARQLVRGYFKCNGEKVKHELCLDETLSDTDWHIDGPVGDRYYGDRLWKSERASLYCDSLPGPREKPSFSAKGKYFRLTDYPGVFGKSGDKLEIYLEFKAQILNKKGDVVDEQGWKVTGKATVS